MGATSEHFSDAELGCRHCGVNRCTQELVWALESLRLLVGKPIIVDDAYRCPAHNAEVGGVPNSEHTRGLAADIRVAGMGAAQLYLLALDIPAIAKGGIGVDERKGYIHIDVRPIAAGQKPPRWSYDAAGKSAPWSGSLPREIPA